MKRCIKSIFAILVMLTCLLPTSLSTSIYAKEEEPTAIAIVFDNSGSMYYDGELAWCRATYAMEVFASMLNKGDLLQIYPMNPIKVGKEEYTMNKPFQISDASQASEIRNIITTASNQSGTPIESIDCAAEGLSKVNIDKKYLIILTDGSYFHKGSVQLTPTQTKDELEIKIKKKASSEMNVMYLGINEQTVEPEVASEYVTIEKAAESSEVSNVLTKMCNQIFGRDTLLKSHMDGNNIDFDISMSKLIVFVQGENISDLKIRRLDGEMNGKLVHSQQVKYAEKGREVVKGNEYYSGAYEPIPDKSLQGMMVTYENCPAGEYEIEYQGKSNSIEVYYEPNADIAVMFTDDKGNKVDFDNLYAGNYKISYGLIDKGVDGEQKFIESDLLGEPHYEVSYTKNGQTESTTFDGQNGEIELPLEMGDELGVDIAVTYLNGYEKRTNTHELWGVDCLSIKMEELGDFQLQLEVPQDYILVKEIKEAQPMKVYLTLDGEKLSTEEFEAVNLDVSMESLKFDVKADPASSSYIITLTEDENVKTGKYEVALNASYLDKYERTSKASDSQKIEIAKLPKVIIWLIYIIIGLLLFAIIWWICHRRVFPKYLHITRRDSHMIYDGEDMKQSTTFIAELNQKAVKIQAKYGGKKMGVSMDVVPGKESYLYKKQRARSAEVKVRSLKKIGSAKIDTVFLGSVKYEIDDHNRLVPAIPNQKPFELKHGNIVRFSGTISDAGINKEFEVVTKLDFKKQK